MFSRGGATITVLAACGLAVVALLAAGASATGTTGSPCQILASHAQHIVPNGVRVLGRIRCGKVTGPLRLTVELIRPPFPPGFTIASRTVKLVNVAPGRTYRLTASRQICPTAFSEWDLFTVVRIEYSGRTYAATANTHVDCALPADNSCTPSATSPGMTGGSINGAASFSCVSDQPNASVSFQLQDYVPVFGGWTTIFSLQEFGGQGDRLGFTGGRRYPLQGSVACDKLNGLDWPIEFRDHLSIDRYGPDGKLNGPELKATSTVASLTCPQPPLTLVVYVPGGGGTVTSSVGGINCGTSTSNCSATLPYGTSVTLTATPDPGRSFFGWRPEACDANTCPQCPNSFPNAQPVSPSPCTITLNHETAGLGTGRNEALIDAYFGAQ